jgi:hypothetical protein
MNDYFDAEGRLYTRDRHEPQAEAPHDEAHIEPPLDSTGLYTVAGADGKPRTRVHSDVLHSIVSGLAERVAVTDEQTFNAEGEAYAKSFAAGIEFARKRVSDDALGRHFVAAMIAVGHSLRPARVTGVAPNGGDVADRFVAEIDALEREAEAEAEQAEAELAEADDDEQPKAAARRRRSVWFPDFVAYMPSHNYIFKPTREPWPGGSVDAVLPKVKVGVDKYGKDIKIRACQWLDQNQAVEQMTWAPGREMLIKDRLVADGGWIEKRGVTVFNLYRPPSIKPGVASKASRWIDHVRKVYPESADHIIKWLASRVQRPEIKINHAIVLGGNQGVGKDTILEPVKNAIGPWNFSEVSPTQMMGRFNGFIKSVILRISEARDLGDGDRFSFYEHTKPVIAAPPDVLRVDEKNLREHAVFNVVGVIITTNNKSNGIYLPADDRRHYVAWSDLERAAFDEDYFPSLYGWFADGGGDRHVAAYLREFELAGFNPKAPPPQTPAFWEIVDSGRAPEDAEMGDTLDRLGNPDAVTLRHLAANAASEEFSEWLNDRKNSRQIPHRLEQCGYVAVRNEAADDGRWKLSGKRQTVYAKKALSIKERVIAVGKLT